MNMRMKSMLAVGALIVAVPLAPHRAAATQALQCCACLDIAALGAQTSAYGGPPIEALFCSEADPGQVPPLEQRCDALANNPNLVCVANITGPSCRLQLAEQLAITCPGANAPVAGAPALAALVVAMGALGAWALRRRTRP
jgi:hypothetical protein